MDSDNYVRAAAYVDGDKYRLLQKILIDKGISFSEFVREYMDKFLSENPEPTQSLLKKLDIPQKEPTGEDILPSIYRD